MNSSGQLFVNYNDKLAFFYLTDFEDRARVNRNQILINQILSTFKFLDLPSTATPAKGQSQSGDLSNWKTYTAMSGLKFSVSYPPGTEVSEENGGVKMIFSGPGQITGTEVSDGFVLWLNSGSLEGKVLEQFAEDYINKNENQTDITKPLARTQLMGMEGYAYETGSYGGSRNIFISPTGNAYLLVSEYVMGSDKSSYQNIIDQILSTLKFD